MKKFLLEILSLAFLTLAFEKDFFWFLGLVALIPYFFLVERSDRVRSVFFYSWILGTAFFLISFRWMLSVFPNDSLGLYSDVYGAILILSAWILLSIFTGLSFGFFGFFLKKLNFLKFKLPAATISIGFLWIISEYLKAFIFSLITWGKGSMIGPYFTFGDLGYLLADTPFFFFARIGGIYGLSFLMAATNVIFYFLIKKKKFIQFFPVLVLIFLISQAFFNFYSKSDEKGEPIKVFLLGIPYGTQQFYRDGFLELVEGKIDSQNQPDLIVFPEGFPLLSLSGELEKSVFQKIFPDQNKNGFVVANKMTFSKNEKISEIIYRDSKGNLIARQQKTFLMPAGETLPVVMKVVALIMGKDEIIEKFRQNREIFKKETQEAPVLLGKTKAGTFLCSGILSPDFSRQLARDGAEIIINSASHQLWRGHQRINRDLELMTRFNAMANNRPIVSSINGDSALAVNANGIVIKKSSPQKAEIISVDVYPKRGKTLSMIIGDWPIIILAMIIIFLNLKKRKD